MKTLKIEIPEGFEVESFDEKKGVVKFKPSPKDVKERIKSIDDILRDNGISEKEHKEKQSLFFDSLEMQHLYYQWLVELLAKSLNEGWTLDWDNSNEYKYFPWFYLGSSGFRFDVYVTWNARSCVGSRLCFKNRELAEYAGKQFTDIYKEFMTIN